MSLSPLHPPPPIARQDPFRLWTTRGGDELNGRYYIFSRTHDELEDDGNGEDEIVINPGDLDDVDLAVLREQAAINLQKLYRGKLTRKSVSHNGKGYGASASRPGVGNRNKMAKFHDEGQAKMLGGKKAGCASGRSDAKPSQTPKGGDSLSA